MTLEAQLAAQQLKRRVRRFLASGLYGRPEVRKLVDELGEFGEVAVFGGMLRDLALAGSKGFSSDVDLVIDAADWGKISQKLAAYRPDRNAFGGYRFNLQRWAVDLWPLSETWAVKAGHVCGESLSDLVKTTFFNWDAIVFDLSKGAVHCEAQYFKELHERMLRINLAVNPNPEGAAIRTLRLHIRHQATLSYELAEYTADVLETVGIERLWELERTKHSPPRVSAETMREFLDQFRQAKAQGRRDPISSPEKQTAFWVSYEMEQLED